MTGPAAADSIDNPARLRALLDNARYLEAETSSRDLLQRVADRHGVDSLEAARVLDLLVEALWRGGKASQPETRQLAERALRVKENELEPDHPDLTPSLQNLAAVLVNLAEYPPARLLYERVLTIREKASGPDHPDVATTLNEFAKMERAAGDYARSMALFERALDIVRGKFGDDHISVARILYNFANLLRDTGDYGTARGYLERALTIAQRELGPDHLHVGYVLNGLANLLEETGDYGAARPLYEHALEIRERTFGPDHLEVASARNNLAYLLRNLGEYTSARPHYERALNIRESVLGRNHPDVAQTLHNLANLLSDMADDEGARPLLERALEIRQRALGADHPTVAANLQDLAALLSRTGNAASATAMYERALSVWKKHLNPDHDHVADSLSGLARLRFVAGDLAGARSLYISALEMREKGLGSGHPRVAETLHDLAAVLVEAGDHAASRPLLERSLDIRGNVLGPDHPLTGQTLQSLAKEYRALGEPERALKAALRAETIRRDHVRLTVRTLPESHALRYAMGASAALDLALTLAVEGAVAQQEEAVWDALVRSRAIVLDAIAARQHEVLEISHLAKELYSARQRLANLEVRGPGPLPAERYRTLVDEARQERERSERALAEVSAGYGREQARHRFGLAEVTRDLPAGTALLAFVRYDHYLPTGPAGAPAGVTAPQDRPRAPGGDARIVPSYAAFVLDVKERKITLVPLGPAEEIDRIVSLWFDEAAHGMRALGRGTAQSEAACHSAGLSLRSKVWDPVAARLRNAQQVFVVPDGALHLVNLAALPDATASYLVETGPLFHHLSSERDLVRRWAAEPAGSGLLALGGPAFDDTSPFAALAPGKVNSLEGVAGEAQALRPGGTARSTCGGFQSIHFEPLPASVQEAREVAALWRKRRAVGAQTRRGSSAMPRAGKEISLLLGPTANEQAFKRSAPGRSVLHVATHGFFLQGRCPSTLDFGRGIGGLALSDGSARPVASVSESPLLLSGLALAGANHRAAAGPEEEDGVLTAEEVAAMDLSAVEWVVLSACDSGAGELKAGEGVLGLRRAFQVAGAGTLIMSLWAVEDETARHWMRALYEVRLIDGLPTADAVRQAAIRMLRQRRQNNQSTHPFYWAGFVAAGNWR